MISFESPFFDPYTNLAVEQYLFDTVADGRDCFMLWRNSPSVIVGKHQNTIAEIDRDYVEKNGIAVVRRLSGGGAVYHDLGNINYTFITDTDGQSPLDMRFFCSPLVSALRRVGLEAEVTGRNDVTVNGMKISGSSQYIRKNRVLHHGCILFQTDLSVLSKALLYRPEKYISKATVSIRSRVVNIASLLPDPDVTVKEFMDILKSFMTKDTVMEMFKPKDRDLKAIRDLRNNRYRTWEWNYGSSPKYDVANSRYVEGCGFMTVSYNVREGVIGNFHSEGDYFGDGDIEELRSCLEGVPVRRDDIAAALSDFPIARCYHGLELPVFLDLILR